MKLLSFIKGEFDGWNNKELVIFPLLVIFIAFVSVFKQDSFVALLSAVCGIAYTFFAGKGKISCYFFGIIATLCYSYLSYLNGFWGNFALNFGYYLSAGIVGFYFWKKNLKKDKQEIIKTQLTLKEQICYCILFSIFTCLLGVFFELTEDNSPYLDSFTTVFSVLGMILTVKRCIEQWYVWFFVNIVSATMWFQAYLNGMNCFVVVLKWLVYAILAIYFLKKWKKEVN